MHLIRMWRVYVVAPVLFFVGRTNGISSHQLNNDSNSSFEGVMYAPDAELDYNGAAGLANACTQVIGKTVTFTGNIAIRSITMIGDVQFESHN